jgi:hypothetical protein
MRMRHATTSKDTHVYVAYACTMQKQAKAGNSGRRWQPPRAADLGAEVGAVDLGIKSWCHGGSTPPRCIFSVKIHGAVMCYLDIMDHSTELGVHFSKLLGRICEFFLPKGLKRKKGRPIQQPEPKKSKMDIQILFT